jgi:hypothetical protein
MLGWRVRSACPEAVRVVDTQDLNFLRQTRGQLLQDKVRSWAMRVVVYWPWCVGGVRWNSPGVSMK